MASTNLELLVTPSEVNEKATEINDQINIMHDVMDQFKNIINRMQEAWQSEASEMFFERFKNASDNVNSSIRILTDHTTHLQQAAAEYDVMEATNIQTATNLSTEKIFSD